MSPLGTLEIPNNRKSFYKNNYRNTAHPMYCIGGTNIITPRGIIIPCTNNTNPSLDILAVNNDPLLKLMSISLVNDRGPIGLNISPPRSPFLQSNHILTHSINSPHNLLHPHLPHPHLIRPDSATSSSSVVSEMLLKSGHLPGGSPVPIPSPSSGSGHPESPKSTADTGITPPNSYISCTNNNNCNNNDDDEVLSIGRDDDHQRMILDCDSSTVLSDQEEEMMGRNDTKGIVGGTEGVLKDYHNNHHLPNSSLGDRQKDNQSQGSSNVSMKSMNTNELEDDEEGEDDDDQSSQNSSEMGGMRMSISSSHSHNGIRNRKYSSEDSFTIKSLCSPTPNYHHNNNSNDTTTSTASPPPSQTNGSNNNSSANNHHRSSTIPFSIANILRPDFGPCNNTPSNNNSPNNILNNPFLPAMMINKSLKSPQGIDFNYATTKRSSSHHHHNNRHHSSGNNSSDSTKSSSRSSQPHRQPQQSFSIINPIDLSRPSSISGGGGHHRHQRNHHNQISSPGGTGHNNVHSNNNHHSIPSKKLKLNNDSTKVTSNNCNNNTTSKDNSSLKESSDGQKQKEWPAWVYCTRYSDRPSSGPRTRRERKNKAAKEADEKRPRTAFTAEQLARLKKEFEENRYLTEKRRQDLARELRLHENQIKIWFQNKRAKLKKASGQRGGLALQLMAQGLYNHSTIPKGDDEDSSDMND